METFRFWRRPLFFYVIRHWIRTFALFVHILYTYKLYNNDIKYINTDSQLIYKCIEAHILSNNKFHEINMGTRDIVKWIIHSVRWNIVENSVIIAVKKKKNPCILHSFIDISMKTIICEYNKCIIIVFTILWNYII